MTPAQSLLWPAPNCPGPLEAHVPLPGSKSQTNRALVLGALSQVPLQILGPLASRDTELAAAALRQLGVTFTAASEADLTVRGPSTFALTGTVDCGLAGTVMRFVPALAVWGEGSVTFDGDMSARSRPLAPLLEALASLGATIQYAGEPGFLPFTLTGRGNRVPPPESVSLDSSASSQFLSALLLASPASPTGYRIELTGTTPSAAHVDMTVEMLESQGVTITREGPTTYGTTPARLTGAPIRIEPDLSNAGPFLAAAVICGGRVTIPDWPETTTQAGGHWQQILPRFGARVSLSAAGLVVEADEAGSWPGGDFDLNEVGELTPTIAALAALAKTPSRLTGIGHLRGHETDRLSALATELRRAGADARELDDGIEIHPGQMHPAVFRSYEDHRMATFGALLGLALPGSSVEDIACTDKTLPNFPARWDALLTGSAAPPLPSLSRALGVSS